MKLSEQEKRFVELVEQSPGKDLSDFCWYITDDDEQPRHHALWVKPERYGLIHRVGDNQFMISNTLFLQAA